MNVLLDTCALLALAEGTLPERAAQSLRRARTAVLSPVVPWELAIKVKTGKLRLPHQPLAWCEALASRHDLILVSLEAPLLCAAADLPLIHRDPFDRVLIAMALEQRLTILTSDQIVPRYPGVTVCW